MRGRMAGWILGPAEIPVIVATSRSETVLSCGNAVRRGDRSARESPRTDSPPYPLFAAFTRISVGPEQPPLVPHQRPARDQLLRLSHLPHERGPYRPRRQHDQMAVPPPCDTLETNPPLSSSNVLLCGWQQLQEYWLPGRRLRCLVPLRCSRHVRLPTTSWGIMPSGSPCLGGS